MSKDVLIPFGDNPTDTAVLLLDAAGDDQEQVRTTSEGFLVPSALANKAGVRKADQEDHTDVESPDNAGFTDTNVGPRADSGGIAEPNEPVGLHEAQALTNARADSAGKAAVKQAEADQKAYEAEVKEREKVAAKAAEADPNTPKKASPPKKAAAKKTAAKKTAKKTASKE